MTSDPSLYVAHLTLGSISTSVSSISIKLTTDGAVCCAVSFARIGGVPLQE